MYSSMNRCAAPRYLQVAMDVDQVQEATSRVNRSDPPKDSAGNHGQGVHMFSLPEEQRLAAGSARTLE